MRKIMLIVAAAVCTMSGAFAQSYDIKEMTPVVKSALEARKARFADIKALKAQGAVGENNQGYVEKLSGGADVKALVAVENKDRKAIYVAIVEQNGLGAGSLGTVEAVFAGVQRDKASAGEKIQDASGAWVTK